MSKNKKVNKINQGQTSPPKQISGDSPAMSWTLGRPASTVTSLAAAQIYPLIELVCMFLKAYDIEVTPEQKYAYTVGVATLLGYYSAACAGGSKWRELLRRVK